MSQHCGEIHGLRKLDSLKLLQLLPGDRLRLPAIQAVRWVGDGEFVRKIYRDWTRSLVEPLAGPKTSGTDLFFLRYFQMTEKTYSEFKMALENLEQEFSRRAIYEMQTQASKTKNVRWAVALDNRSFVTGK